MNKRCHFKQPWPAAGDGVLPRGPGVVRSKTSNRRRVGRATEESGESAAESAAAQAAVMSRRVEHGTATACRAGPPHRADGWPEIRSVGYGRNLVAEHAAGNGVETHPHAGSGDASYYDERSLASET